MEVDKFGGTCKMCDRPYSVFKWRPGRGQPYRKTEVSRSALDSFIIRLILYF